MGCVVYCPDFSCCDDWDSLDDTTKDRSETLAWDTLRVLTGGLVGNCPVMIRPCLSDPCSACATFEGGWTFAWMTPYIDSFAWYNAPCQMRGCSCPPLSEIVLPGPVADLTFVMVDGFVLGRDTYRLDNGNRLVRVDCCGWPSCQDMRKPYTETGTLAVGYVPGIRPGVTGSYAAGVLACEYAKACSGQKCRLPSSVTSITRQGVSMSISEGMFSNGLTGIREVDAYIKSVNPNALTIPPKVWSPDGPVSGHRFQTQYEATPVLTRGGRAK